MKKLYDAADRFCARHPRFGIPDLMRWIVIGNGRLTEEQAAQQLRAWGLTAHRWLRQLEARHLFTHIRWDMTGYLVQVEGRGPEDWLWADGAIRARLAVPSAFEKFTRALPAEGE